MVMTMEISAALSLPANTGQSRWRPALRGLYLSVALLGSLAVFQPFANAQGTGQGAETPADELAPPPPPPPEDMDATGDEAAPPPESGSIEIEPLNPGEAVVTRFSHAIDREDESGGLNKAIDVNGTSASIVDVRRPGVIPGGQHWTGEPQRMPVTAGEVGQVFGVALGDLDGGAPDIYLSATSAFGLHRVPAGESASGWMAGMWGPDSGPGTVYRIGKSNGYVAEKFTDVTLNGRLNSGAALGNIAFDRWHNQLFVSDLETGLIHRIDAKSGEDIGHYDHGTSARPSFMDSWSGSTQSLDPVSFDPASKAKTESCSGDFSKTPDCWNIADFRRRIWGIGVRRDQSGGVRLYYSVWGSDALGSADWAGAGDDRRNAVWSVGIAGNGGFDPAGVRREFFLPAFWPSSPGMGSKAGNGNPASDITFPQCGPQNVMIVSERGGVRNLGLDKTEPFARPHESRVLRYELGGDNIWRPKGRYDVGFHDRRGKEGVPFVFANTAGGADFGFGYDGGGFIDTSAPDKSLWMTGDSLCSPNGPCISLASGQHDDSSEVHGLQGSPADVVKPVEAPEQLLEQTAAGTGDDFGALDRSYMIDMDINVDETGAPIAGELSRNDATKIGDVAIYQMCEATPVLPVIGVPDEPDEVVAPPDEPDEVVAPPDEPPEWPVHTIGISHEKQASSGHGVNRSWHRRNASFHAVERSWHWRNQSWHSRNQSWHWREGSWHSKQRSWHRKGHSLHSKQYSWHFRDRSWHMKIRTYHAKNRTWGEQHVKGRTYHVKGRTWGEQHVKGRTYHVKGRTWGEQHVKGRTYHTKGKTWGDDPQDHVKGKTYHVKGRTWGGNPQHVKGKTYHVKGRTWGGGPIHVKGKSNHVKGKTFGGGGPVHVKGKSDHVKGKTFGGGGPIHVKGKSNHVKGKTFGGGGPVHVKGKSDHVKGKTFGDIHAKKKSRADQGGGQTGGGDQPVHTKKKSLADQGGGQTGGGDQPVHTKKKSLADQGGGQTGGGDQPVHTKKKSRADQGGGQPKGGDQPEAPKKRHLKGKSFHEKATSNFVEAS
jgi:hypothetical protein